MHSRLKSRKLTRLRHTVENLQILGIGVFEQEEWFFFDRKTNITGGEVSTIMTIMLADDVVILVSFQRRCFGRDVGVY